LDATSPTITTKKGVCLRRTPFESGNNTADRNRNFYGTGGIGGTGGMGGLGGGGDGAKGFMSISILVISSFLAMMLAVAFSKDSCCANRLTSISWAVMSGKLNLNFPMLSDVTVTPTVLDP